MEKMKKEDSPFGDFFSFGKSSTWKEGVGVLQLWSRAEGSNSDWFSTGTRSPAGSLPTWTEMIAITVPGGYLMSISGAK